MNLFSEKEPPLNSIFKAIYFDESGDAMFERDENGKYWFFNEDEPVDGIDWFYEAGFMSWELVNE